MDFIFACLMALSLVALVWCTVKMIQLRHFSAAVRTRIDTLFAERFRLIDEGIYEGEAFNIMIDIGKSYQNFNWSAPWNFNFDKIIVMYEQK